MLIKKAFSKYDSDLTILLEMNHFCDLGVLIAVDSVAQLFLTAEDFLRPLNVWESGKELYFNGYLHYRFSIAFYNTVYNPPPNEWSRVNRPESYAKTHRKGARRNGVITGIKKWPNGRIPYVISAQYNERERAVLARSFQEYHKRTCVRFVARTAFDNDYLYIGKIDGCFSDVGRAGGRQELSLDDGSIHELMHSVGFYHEHERWDRDSHITILWHNIDRDAYDQFGKVDLTESSYYGQAYDYYSIMHYDSLAFSKNGFETMLAKRPEMTAIIGAAIDFSPVDIIKINLMYQCNDVKIPSTAEAGLNLINKPIIVPPPHLEPLLPPVVLSNTLDECRDRTNLCWRWLDRCRSFFFEKIMKEFCALSCGFCTVRPIIAKTDAKDTRPSYLQFG
uniref:Metalloendopeptidase n=1 Tax=Heterorhabditis bacteriophora TaxID=37862 RepID=A0A1I7WMM8_HETBA